MNKKKVVTVAPALLCAAAIVFASLFVPFTLSQTSYTFGNTTEGTVFESNDANTISVSYFQCTTSGSYSTIFAYIATPSNGSVMAALYSTTTFNESGGYLASALLAYSGSVTVGNSYSWVTFTLTTPYSTLRMLFSDL